MGQNDEVGATTDYALTIDQPEPGAGKQRSPQFYSLACKEGVKQWHYDRHGEPQANGWTIISEPCPEYQLKLFTYFMDFTPERKNVSGEAMK